MRPWYVSLFRLLDRAGVCYAYARARAWSLVGAAVGSRVRVHKGCRFERPWGISLGERARVEPRVFFHLAQDEAELRIGAFTFIGAGTQIDVLDMIEIGHHTLIGPGCFISDHDHKFESAVLRIDQQNCAVDHVSIGNDVWLGAGVAVLSGVVIGDGAVIGAGAVVRDSIPPYSIAVGVPAKVVGQRLKVT